MKEAIPSVAAVLLAITGVAVVGVIVSNRSDSSNIIVRAGQAFAKSLRCAMGPIIGGSADCGYPASSTLPIGVSSTTITFGKVGES